MTTRRLRRRLREAGCEEVRQSGSHLVVRCPGGCQTVVPIHSGDIGRGLLRAIERQLEECLGKGWLQ